MEIKKAERVVIDKPVATRPTCTNYRSFSELLAGAINSSPPSTSETAVAAIRPKTVRFKPTVNCGPPSTGSSGQAEVWRTTPLSAKVTRSDTKSTVLYRPQAKLVSKTAISILSNMGNFTSNQQQLEQQLKARIEHPKQDDFNFELYVTSSMSNPYRSRKRDQKSEPSRLTTQNEGEDPKALPPTANVDRPSYDGYNWRKYGQKQVKGSEYPRSYYKCTHPNCPVKKKVERSFDGQITEIVYKSEHNHAKPQPPKRNSTSGTQALGLATEGISGQDVNNERNDFSEGKVENQKDFHGKSPVSCDPTRIGSTTAAGAGMPDNSGSLSGDCNDGSRGTVGDDEPRSKRRKSENQSNEVGRSTIGGGPQEPHVVVQSSTEPEILGDGFRWRKYGQKIVKGNPYPRFFTQ